MLTQKFTLFKDIDVSKTDFSIHVRVIRRWTTKDYKNPNDYFSIELIIIDEENNRMQCTVLKRFAKQFDKLLDENLPLCSVRPSQAENRAKYKHVPCDHKIVFNQYTKVTLSTSFKGNPFGFVFADFADILDKNLDADALIDVIGHIVTVFDKHNITRADGSLSTRRNIKIHDLQNRSVFITLWGSYCDQMDSFIKDHPDETNVVILLQFAKCHWFQGEPYVSNSFDVARLWIDADIDEISLYKSSLLGIGADNSSISQQSIADSIISSGPSIEDDFLKNTCFCFISDIHDLTEAKSVIILGTIKGIDKDIKWFYEACSKCFKKAAVFYDKTHIECSNQNCHTLERSLIIRYKIHLRVQDSTGTVTITMFDRDRKFLGISAQNLLQDNNQSPPNESVNFPLGKIELTATMSIKDTVSSTGENITPLSDIVKSDAKKDLAASTSESPDCLVTGVKSNLSNVYDLDDNLSPSSGKSRSNEKTTAAQKLIVPKVEK